MQVSHLQNVDGATLINLLRAVQIFGQHYNFQVFRRFIPKLYPRAALFKLKVESKLHGSIAAY